MVGRGLVISTNVAGCGVSARSTARFFRIATSRSSKLPHIERERLQRNVAEFEKMSPAEQERYRELNRQLEATDNKNLATLLQTYSAWLQTLTPGQREELRQEKDSQKKLATGSQVQSGTISSD